MSLLLKFFFKCLMSSGHPLILKFDALSNCLGAPKGFIPAWLDWVVSLGHPQPSVSVGLFSQTGDLQISSQGSRLTFGAFWELSEEKGRDLIIQYVYCDLNVLFSVHHFAFSVQDMRSPCFGKTKNKKLFFFPCWVTKRKFSGWVCWKRWIWARCMCAQLFPTLCSLRDCSLPGSSVHGIFQARILEWVAIFFSRGSLQPKDWTQVSGIGRQMFYHCNKCKVLESGQGVGLIAFGFWSQDCFQEPVSTTFF